MFAKALKKSVTASAYPAATDLFEQLAGLFANSTPHSEPKLEPRRLDASLKALQQAPSDEVAAVSQILKEISARVIALNETSPNMNTAGASSPAKRMAAALVAAKAEDAMVQGLLARANKDAPDSAPTAEQEQENAEVMFALRRDSAAALQRRIDRKELLPPKEFQDALRISRQSINEAVKARRMFALLGPGGEYYYPAFFADGDLNRRDVEKVAKALGSVPGASKYHFFTSKSTSLGSVTPLAALKEGRLDDVLVAATAFGER